MINKPLVSIIVPVYNVEAYLDECMQSVINQTYTNLEIILVDDGATDASGKMCDEYAKKDSRITVIHKSNGGLSSARNAALDIMKGEYVFFQDSDDYIALDLIETYLSYMKEYQADIVIGTYLTFWGKVSHDISDRTNCPVKVFHRNETIRKMLMNEEIEHSASGPLFKAYLYDDIRFPVDKNYEDFATTYYVVAKSNKVVFTDDKRGYYRVRPGSIMNSSADEKEMVLLDIADQVTGDMALIDDSLIIPALRKKVITYLNVYSDILAVGFNSFEKEQNRIELYLRNNAKQFLKTKEIRNKEKIKLRLFQTNKTIFYLASKGRYYFHRIIYHYN